METTFGPEFRPSTHEIRAAFEAAVGGLGGAVRETYDDGHRLFARGVLPTHAEVRPADRVQAGVALRAAGPEIRVHPYTFRQVCSNGAIVAHATSTLLVERIELTDVVAPTYEVTAALAAVGAAVRACAAPRAFAVAVQGMREAAEVEADIMLQLLPALAQMPEHAARQLAPLIVARFNGQPDRSAYGLLNAATSVGRDARDPELRWHAELLGGTMPARLGSRPARRAAPALALVST